MELSPKAIRFILEALDYRIKAYEDSLDSTKINEDESSEIGNDVMYLQAIYNHLYSQINNQINNQINSQINNQINSQGLKSLSESESPLKED
jgi:hypothetical protein